MYQKQHMLRLYGKHIESFVCRYFKINLFFFKEMSKIIIDNAIICAIILEVVHKSLPDNPKNVSFEYLVALCKQYFGEYRVKGSHYIFKTPWKGDPRINLQKDGNRAKPYQVRQVKRAIEKLEGECDEEG